MGLLSSIFGSSKKTTTTATTTQATQTSIDNSGGGVYASGSTLDLSSVNNTDSRNMSDNRNMSQTTVIDPSDAVLVAVAEFANEQNTRFLSSVDALNRNGYEATGAAFNAALGAVVEANKSDGAQVLSTVENMTKYVVIGIAALGAFAVLRG